eukprot:7282742-Heterocapsa_arctica.AAC.1
MLRGMILILKFSNTTRNPGQRRNRSVQTTKKGKTDKKAYCVTHAVGTITNFSQSDQLMAEPVTPAPQAFIRGRRFIRGQRQI